MGWSIVPQEESRSKMTLTCTCCKQKKQITAKDDVDERRFDHIYDLMVASIRTQGYQDGYLCRSCAKSKGIRFDLVDDLARNYMTRKFFESRKHYKVVRLEATST